ncbi:MAG TPA: NUDIX domain-containing protein, partial [Candidatus Omnitrophota bacterium]|nr:NUDIX domain-containing protein [Candidatus Omnitrophota bacterium]
IGSSLFALAALRLLTGRRLTPRQVLFVLLVGPLVGTFVALWYADSSFLQMQANPSLSLMFPGIGGLMKVGDKSTTQTDISLDQGIADSMKDRGFDKNKLHVKARGPHPAYPKRSIVPDELVRWITNFFDYNPVEFTHQNVFDNDKTKKPGGWADKPDTSEIDRDSIKSYEGRVEFDPEGRPLNPMGRTGMKGRGLLGHWGPNFAADPIITRYNPESGELEVLLILRKDTGEWAIPGGMVDYGEKLSGTLKRELNEETGVVLTEEDMNSGILVYQGYVDDPRNTDNAWMETTAVHLHLTPEKAVTIRLKAGDDAKEVKWIRFNEEILDHLYASHGDFLRNVLESMSSKNNQRPGGIDFRALPLMTQTGIESAVSAQAIGRLQQLAAGSSIRDLDKEWAGIVKQIRGRQMPYAKMQEYAAMCFARNADSRYMDMLVAGVNDILKMEEACAVRTSPEMKELLVLIETARGSTS